MYPQEAVTGCAGAFQKIDTPCPRKTLYISGLYGNWDNWDKHYIEKYVEKGKREY